ncbi:hypothetical protein ES705_37038 [subsurface metagenome]
MKRYSFYVVFVGQQTGIFECWHTQVKPFTTGFPGAKKYGFDNFEDANKAWRMGLEKYEAIRFRDRI